MKARKAPEVITANRLLDGDVVYMTADLSWSDRFTDAHVIAPEDDMTPFLDKGAADIAARLVVDVYAFPVTLDGGVPQPISARETIRAAGPTIRLDLGKQAEG